MIKVVRSNNQGFPAIETYYSGKDIITHRERFPSECTLTNTDHLDYTCRNCGKSKNDHFVLAQARIKSSGCNAFFQWGCNKKGTKGFEQITAGGYKVATKQLRKKLLACDGCGKCSKDVQRCIDPYSVEINDTTVDTNLCDLCYQSRVDDI